MDEKQEKMLSRFRANNRQFFDKEELEDDRKVWQACLEANGIGSTPMPEKPPLGVMPRWMWVELRLEAVEAAICRYREAGKTVPDEWNLELPILEKEVLSREVGESFPLPLNHSEPDPDHPGLSRVASGVHTWNEEHLSPSLDDMIRDFRVRMQKYNQSMTEWADRVHSEISERMESIRESIYYGYRIFPTKEDHDDFVKSRVDPALPEGFFRIGEEVEARGTGNLWYSGKVGVLLEKGGFYSSSIEVRRKPAWKPKDGEAVLFRHRESVGAEWKTALGTFSKGRIYFGDHRMSAILLCLKPFDGDYEQIGKPWSEI